MKHFLLLLLFISHQAFAQSVLWQAIQSVPDASFRGLSVVDVTIAWVSGSKGWVGRSTNGGHDWDFKKIPSFEQCDFRSLYAFNAKTAIIANAGAPAFILRTDDSGLTWKTVYKNEDTAAFFDGIDFWNDKDGIIYGDPIKGRMMILRTHDGGHSWQEIPESNRPVLAEGEASFAASGTNIRCLKKGKVIIATGGKVSRLWISDDKGMNWLQVGTSIIQGTSTTGIFSIAFLDEETGIIAGGDYKRDTLKSDHVFYTKNGGKTWIAPKSPTGGYRECVEYINQEMVIATGPGGTDISKDGGINWQPLSDEKGFHVARKSRYGRTIIMTGNGKISIAEY